VEVHTILDVDVTNAQTGKAALQTSFAALGLLGHRPRSIFAYYEYVVHPLYPFRI
jgi:hypothetical protein